MQHQLAEAVVKENNFELNQLSVVGGIDISFVPNSETTACVALVVMKYPIFFAKKQEVSSLGNIHSLVCCCFSY